MNKLKINSILQYGYDPTCAGHELPVDISEVLRSDSLSSDERKLTRRFHEAIDAELGSEYSKNHVVPLSSGLDSRAILAGLLRHSNVSKSDIYTVTFGSPGTWDYEIGQQVAQRAGVENVTVDVSHREFDWSLDTIQEYVESRSSLGRVFDGYINWKAIAGIDETAVVWSGFMGDPSVGGHQPDNPSEHWHTACKQFANEQQFCNNLSHPNFEPTTVLPTDPIVPKEKLSYEEQLDFALRQQCLIKPIVIHDDSYKTPFMTQEWLEISLNLPRSHREDRSLFKKAFKSEFPTLFSLPTDASAGLSLSSTRLRRDIRMKRLGLIREVASLFGVEYLHPNTNYIDFATELRKDTEFRKALYQLVSDFAEGDRCNWICPLEIWEAHQSGEDLVNELRTIASLELYLKRGQL